MARSDQPSESRDAANDLANRVVDAGARAADAAGRVAAHVEDTRNELMAQGSELSANVQKVGKNFSKALADEPMTTLALAVAAGFILAAIW